MNTTLAHEMIALHGDHGQRGRLAAMLFADLDERITKRGVMHARIAQCAHEGRIVVVESGRDCDGVQYSGRTHEIDASLKALVELEDHINEWADGPFSLAIVPWNTEVEYTSRDLVLEAYENGHPHVIYG